MLKGIKQAKKRRKCFGLYGNKDVKCSYCDERYLCKAQSEAEEVMPRLVKKACLRCYMRRHEKKSNETEENYKRSVRGMFRRDWRRGRVCCKRAANWTEHVTIGFTDEPPDFCPFLLEHMMNRAKTHV